MLVCLVAGPAGNHPNENEKPAIDINATELAFVGDAIWSVSAAMYAGTLAVAVTVENLTLPVSAKNREPDPIHPLKCMRRNLGHEDGCLCF